MSDAQFMPAQSQEPAKATFKYALGQESSANFVGKTIGQLRADFRKAWNIPDNAPAFKGKTAVSDDYVICPGDFIELQRNAGEKG